MDVMDISQINESKEHQLEKYVLLLNHCFEDIEKFLSRLQYIGESLKQLELYNCEQYIYLGDKLLPLCFHPPLEYEFHDILAKHKLAFNYIVKSPNNFQDSVESIHHLFLSLETIVNVCNNIYENQQLPNNVVDPLMNMKTIIYLKSCLNAAETKFWLSLGLNWIQAKEYFKDHKGQFKPTFFDGWSPDWIVDETAAYTPHPINSVKLGHDNQILWLRNLQSQNVKIAAVLYNKLAKNNKELNVNRGEYLEVIHHFRNWWKCRNILGLIGYVPYTILSAYNFECTPHSAVKNIETESLLLENEQMHYNQSQSVTRKNSLPRSISMPNVPVPPPMPLNTTTPVTSMKRNINRSGEKDYRNYATNNNRVQLKSSIHDELKLTLQQRERRKDLEILVTPDIYINQNSNSKQVEDWLKAKAFSHIIINKLKGLNGQELFALSPQLLESYFGHKESRRLVSQILLQKNISEYKTMRSSELSAKLAKARQKVDENNSAE